MEFGIEGEGGDIFSIQDFSCFGDKATSGCDPILKAQLEQFQKNPHRFADIQIISMKEFNDDQLAVFLGLKKEQEVREQLSAVISADY